MAELGLTGLMAEFDSETAIVAATNALIEEGYRELDAFTPRPIEALQDAIAPERSSLPRSVFIGGLCGALTGLGGQWFCNAWDLPLNVGGRPPFSLPAFIPITFELMVLFAALTAFFGVLHRARLPHLTHPVFTVEGFSRASIDRFWLFVSASDPHFDRVEAEALLRREGCVTLQSTASDADMIREGARS
jgi:hypothetical protein